MPTDSTRSRRRPGIGRLLALVVVPLLLALVGWGVTACAKSDEPRANPSGSLNVSSTGAAGPGGTVDDRKFGPMSIVRVGTGFTLTGEFPDAATKASLVQSIGQAMPGAKIIDQLTVNPAVKAPEFSALGALFGTALDITGFSSTLQGDTLTLAGTAPAVDVKAAAAAAAGVSWPNVKIVNDIRVEAPGTTSASPAPSPPPPHPSAPAPEASTRCATVGADVTGLLKTPITFATDGFAFAPDLQGLVRRIADLVKACPNARVTVVGHTDDTGGDGINVPLSASRATAVTDALVSDGVAATAVTSRGAGSANPIAGNDTAAGRAQNRRVEITVS